MIFTVSHKGSKVCSFEYLVIEEHQYYDTVFLFGLHDDSDSAAKITQGETIVIVGVEYTLEGEKRIIYRGQAVLEHTILLDRNEDNFCFFAQLEYSESDYDEYNQPLLDLMYYWDKEPLYVALRKKMYVYTEMCMMMTGVPDVPFSDKHAFIDGQKIDTRYELLNTLAEMFMGSRGYLGHDLDSLEDSFQTCKMTQEYNNRVSISSYNLLSRKIDYEFPFMTHFVELLIKYGIDVTIENVE